VSEAPIWIDDHRGRDADGDAGEGAAARQPAQLNARGRPAPLSCRGLSAAHDRQGSRENRQQGDRRDQPRLKVLRPATWTSPCSHSAALARGESRPRQAPHALRPSRSGAIEQDADMVMFSTATSTTTRTQTTRESPRSSSASTATALPARCNSPGWSSTPSSPLSPAAKVLLERGRYRNPVRQARAAQGRLPRCKLRKRGGAAPRSRPGQLWSGRTEARAELAGYGRCGRPAQPLLMTWPRCRLSGALNAAVAYDQAGRDGSA
jgi:hypothetical protein